MPCRACLLSAAAALLAAATAPAQTYQYEWEIGGTTYTAATPYTFGATGSKVSINLYIREVGGSTLSTRGLGSANGLVVTSQPATGARVLADSDLFPNTQFPTLPEKYATYNMSAAQHLIAVNAPPGVGNGVTGAGLVLVGRYEFTIQGQTATTLTASDEGVDYGTFLATTLTDTTPTAITVGTATLGLNPVPEPVGLLGLAAVGLLAARRHRRTATATAASPASSAAPLRA